MSVPFIIVPHGGPHSSYANTFSLDFSFLALSGNICINHTSYLIRLEKSYPFTNYMNFRFRISAGKLPRFHRNGSRDCGVS